MGLSAADAGDGQPDMHHVVRMPACGPASLYNAGLYSAVLAGAADRHLAVAACHFDEEFVATINGELIFAVVWLGIIVSVLAYGQMFRLIRRRNATRVSALQYFVPPVTMIIAWIVFGETLTLNGLMGLGVTSMGFWLI